LAIPVAWPYSPRGDSSFGGLGSIVLDDIRTLYMVYSVTFKKKSNGQATLAQVRTLIFVESGNPPTVDKIESSIRRDFGDNHEKSSIDVMATENWNAEEMRKMGIHIDRLC
jgi:hypothetical protein